MDIQISGTAKISTPHRGPVQRVVAIGGSTARPVADPASGSPKEAAAGAAVAASTQSDRAPAAAGDTASGSSAVVKLRFPWLSRISEELEPVARQKPPFKTLPITGDNVDHAV